MSATPRAFQVDLRGVVDLLGQHLYSGPRVYLRELLQNAVDAITARRDLHLEAPGVVRLRPFGASGLAITDSGIGLTADEATELLATVGRSSKRDELGLARSEFLGQFGIGLLSAFMVADSIELVTRSAREDSPAVLWRGFGDGTFELVERPDLDVPVGTTVWLRARRDLGHWLDAETVAALAVEFGGLLAVDLAIEVPIEPTADLGGCDSAVAAAGLPSDPRDGHLWRRLTEPGLPWLRQYRDAAERSRALSRYCEATFGFAPLATIDLEVPLAGVTGVAFVLPSAVPPAGGGAHRVYLKRMLLGTRIDDLLPDWAFFVRCVIDASGLRPTASREQLYVDEVLLATQESLAGAVRGWTERTLTAGGPLARTFVQTHHLALRSLALTDDAMLDLATSVLPFETTDGPRTLAEVAQEHGTVVFTPSLEQYRRVASVARAQGVVVVNAGYVYDGDLLARLSKKNPGRYRPLSVDDIAQVLALPSLERELATADAVERARELLADWDCEPQLRSFEPADVPAMLLVDRDGEHQRELRDVVAERSDPWSDVLEGFATSTPSRRLVLNDASPIVHRLLSAPPGPVVDAGTRALYVQALLLSGEPLRSRESALMSEAMSTLLERGLAVPDVADPTNGQER